MAYCHALLNIFGSTARLTMGLRKERGQWLRRARASLVSGRVTVDVMLDMAGDGVLAGEHAHAH